MINYLLVFIVSLLFAILLIASWAIRRTRRIFNNHAAAAQLRRGAGHIYKVAGTAKIYAPQDAISRLLLKEAARMLDLAMVLEPHHRSTRAALHECNTMRASLSEAKPDCSVVAIVAARYPDSVPLLLEAQLHLREASRLIGGMEKRGLLSPRSHQSITSALLDAQRSLELHLDLRQAICLPDAERAIGIDPERGSDYLRRGLIFC